MKTVFTGTFVTLVGIVFVVPFVTVALLVGARAVAAAESTEHRLLLVALAVGGALFSGAKNFTRRSPATREAIALHVTQARERNPRHAFPTTHGY